MILNTTKHFLSFLLSLLISSHAWAVQECDASDSNRKLSRGMQFRFKGETVVKKDNHLYTPIVTTTASDHRIVSRLSVDLSKETKGSGVKLDSQVVITVDKIMGNLKDQANVVFKSANRSYLLYFRGNPTVQDLLNFKADDGSPLLVAVCPPTAKPKIDKFVPASDTEPETKTTPNAENI